MTDATVIQLDIARLTRVVDPRRASPWDTLLPVTEHDVRSALRSRRFSRRHSRPLPEDLQGSCAEHAGRIAWLMHNGWTDPIAIDCELYPRGLWPITDGNHRFYAALLLEATHISATICGSETAIREMLGACVVEQVFAAS